MESVELLRNEFGEFAITSYEKWNQAYEGLILEVGNQQFKVRSRLAKKTPKKAGYFVAFWEQDEFKKNQPFAEKNSPEILAIVILDQTKTGIFVFPKEVLGANQILSTKESKGKMAMRVYPPWCINLNKTAAKTQQWQLAYFKKYSN